MGLHRPGSRAVLRHVARGSSASRTTQPGQSWAWRCTGTRAGPPPRFRDASSELHSFPTLPTWLSAHPSQLHPAPSADPPAQLGPRSAGDRLGEAGVQQTAPWLVTRLEGSADQRGPPAPPWPPTCSLPTCVPFVLYLWAWQPSMETPTDHLKGSWGDARLYTRQPSEGPVCGGGNGLDSPRG